MLRKVRFWLRRRLQVPTWALLIFGVGVIVMIRTMTGRGEYTEAELRDLDRVGTKRPPIVNQNPNVLAGGPGPSSGGLTPEIWEYRRKRYEKAQARGYR
jgi:hypothetical protein